VSVTLDIPSVTRGDGIAELDGQRYFVPFTLPGETVEAEPRDRARGSPRICWTCGTVAPCVVPPCAHFKVCGGCALQHWRRDAYTAWKVELIVTRWPNAASTRAALRGRRRRAGRTAACRLCCAGRARACWRASTSGPARGIS
jgi:tRNA/tmRNA/rRNA uracil-C5-methylase (TrmA/RlmC/RlmD family)